ncbi:CaiB/BaiF CoA-transferase family protein [Aeromicrobium tamlense]|uniref:Alpha-methylacyl-CoA racemase n=1 Tax=Aeromicrobium tamlense TaxID=375541 RepID=A0ABX2SPB5_9ACTN|nr:CaiB/BaiF CoA-transferase family protein [Aeromicrobium tamlense]NYI39502.1 alpha-methylacyl-CoA racemase [Aeromicrobium tamlense]
MTQSTGPLSGVRVVEMVGIGPGPFAAMLLADLGADVIRIDRPGGNALQVAPPERDILGRNRPSAAVDLKTSEGVELVLQLVERADILLEGFRPGVMERLGLGPEVALERNPRLVYGRMTGWGQTGPLASSAGHDVNYIAVAGGLDPIGRAGGPPQVPLNLLGDFAGGSMYLVTGVLAALTHARGTGEGQVVDAAITDGVAHLMAMTVSMQQSGAWSPRRGTNLLDTGAPFYDVYETSDGYWMSVGGLEPRFWYAMQEVFASVGLGDLPDRNDPKNWAELRETLRTWFLSRTQEEWTALFAGTDACVAPVVPLEEAYEHPHHVARGTYVEEYGITQPAPAPRFSATGTGIHRAPDRPGASTREALTAWGIEDVDDLIENKVAVENEEN